MNRWGYQKRIGSRIECPGVVINSRERGNWAERGRCSPGPGVAQTIRESSGKTCSRCRARHSDGIGSRRGREGNRNRDIFPADRSARSDGSNRKIKALALRQIIGWADERIWSACKCPSSLRKVCIDGCGAPSTGGSQDQIVLAADSQDRLGWRTGLAS